MNEQNNSTNYDIYHSREIVSYVTQITTIHIYVRATCALQFPNYRNKQISYTFRVFNECLNMSDVGENFSNTKKSRINLLPEHHYR